MHDPRFRRPINALPLAAVAALGAAALPDGADPATPIDTVAALAEAGPGELAVADGAQAATDLRSTRAAACFVAPALRDEVPPGTVALVTDAPVAAFLAAAAVLAPETRRPVPWADEAAHHATAIIHPSVRIEPGVAIGPATVIAPEVEIGTGTTIGPACVIERGVRIGRFCAIGPQVMLAHALVGDRVVVHGGARIGIVEAGTARLGRAIVQDGVEIGSNAVVARGAWRDTVIGEGAIIEATASIGGDVVVARRAIVRNGA